MTWPAIGVLACGAYLFKLAGLVIGNRLRAERVRRAIALIPPALFCALVALQTFERDTSLVVDARAVGLAAAVVASWRRVPFPGVIVIAMAATALTRALTS